MPEKVINHDDEDLAGFLVEDYQLKADYLSEHFSRMWTRFNFFLSVETALFGVVFVADKDEWSKHAVLFAGFGVLVSLFWYAFGAQDRYLVELYRDEIKFAAQRLTERFKQRLGSDSYENVFFNYRYVGDTADKAEGIRPGLFQWRCAAISVTRLAAIFPAAVMVAWGIMIGFLAISK
jgi:hypothetical protein